MLIGQKKVLTREQFIQLREARRLIKAEFSECIQLSDDDILDTIYEYALKSEGEELFDLFNLINNDATAKNAVNSQGGAQNKGTKGMGSAAQKTQIGDVIDGRMVVNIYRGKPVFK